MLASWVLVDRRGTLEDRARAGFEATAYATLSRAPQNPPVVSYDRGCPKKAKKKFRSGDSNPGLVREEPNFLKF